MVKSGEPRATPPRDLVAGVFPPPPAHPTNPSRPIRNPRSRLDPAYPFDQAIRSRSSGPDSIIQIGPSDPDRTVRFPRADRTIQTPPFRSDRPNRIASEPLDLDRVAWLEGTGSPWCFVKEPLSFFKINLQSTLVQK
jgi:hypothetical protein